MKCRQRLLFYFFGNIFSFFFFNKSAWSRGIFPWPLEKSEVKSKSESMPRLQGG